MEVLKYAHENGCPWDEWTCSNAAKGGHLDVLRYAHENGCPWDEMTCAFAAEGGHLDVLKWLRIKGCPWGFSTYAFSVASDGIVWESSLGIQKWALENGCPLLSSKAAIRDFCYFSIQSEYLDDDTNGPVDRYEWSRALIDLLQDHITWDDNDESDSE